MYSILSDFNANVFVPSEFDDFDRFQTQLKQVFELISAAGDKDAMNEIALCYCLGICDETRTHIKDIYDFESGFVKPECLHIGWQTGSSVKVVRMAFNLYCNGMPSVNDEMSIDEVISESRRYSAEDLFCDPYAPYFWQAIKLRYPEYTSCDNEPPSISY